MSRGLPATLIVAAHPDDEVLGAGIWMHRRAGSPIHILHITDGSPRDMQTAGKLGFATRKAYADARRRELGRALSVLEIPSGNCIQLNLPDQEACLYFPTLIEQTAALIAKIQPARVLSPAYEGGHPDHDAAAFAVALARRKAATFEHWEFPLYHANRNGRMITGKFIPASPARREIVISLTPKEQLVKSAMLACFVTQKEILSCFQVKLERFRRAPSYDFAKPAHRGLLLYERFKWGTSGADWRIRALQALEGPTKGGH